MKYNQTKIYSDSEESSLENKDYKKKDYIKDKQFSTNDI